MAFLGIMIAMFIRYFYCFIFSFYFWDTLRKLFLKYS